MAKKTFKRGLKFGANATDKMFNLKTLSGDYDSYKILMAEIATIVKKYPIATIEEEQAFIWSIQNEDERTYEFQIASKILFGNNLRMVNSIAAQFAPSWNRMDVLQEGAIAMVKAAKAYDLEKYKVRFGTYAVDLIRAMILDALNEKTRTVRIPKNAGGQLVDKYNQTMTYLKSVNPDVEVTPQDVADELGWDDETLVLVFTAINPSDSADAPMGNDDENITNFYAITDSGIANPERQYIKNESIANSTGQLLKIIEETFGENERTRRTGDVLIESFGIGKEYPAEDDDALAEKHGLTRQRIVQMRQEGLAKLQKRHGKKLRKLFADITA